MVQSSDIRKKNKEQIYRIMLDGELYTKQRLSIMTGLSVATCNTLLNDMEASQILVRWKEKELRGIGRGSVLYSINAEHDKYIVISIRVSDEKRIVDIYLLDAYAKKLVHENKCYELFDMDDLEQSVSYIVTKHRNISNIVISVPGVIEHDLIKYSDIKEIEGKELMERFAQFDCKTIVLNDMHAVALGYQASKHNQEEVITFALFMNKLLPGSVTMYNGQIISGSQGIAGLLGFLPFSHSRTQMAELMTKDTSYSIIYKCIGVILALLNPSVIVLSGDLIDEAVMEKMQNDLSNSIPEEYIPHFTIIDSFHDYIVEGMFQKALAEKIF